HTNENALFVIDAGTQNPYMASDYVTKKSGRRTVFDRGHGNLGYALSAAIGAQVASPQSKVFSMFGDGSFAMSVGELETASRLGLPVVFLLFQNNSYGWIKKLHQLYYDERYIGVDFSQINGAKIAEGFNIRSLRIDSNEKLEEGLKWAIDQQGPVFLDILIEPITDIVPPVTNWREDSKLDPSKREALTY
ncbi:thiamine pyrophosphate-dependent enzyme, partial [Bacillus sp. JJ1503]